MTGTIARWCILACFVPAIAQAAPIVVRVAPGSQTVDRADIFTATLVADIPATSGVIAWGLDLVFDPSILVLTQVDVAAPWQGPPFAPNEDFDGLAGFYFSLLPPFTVSGDGIPLATLTFRAGHGGTTSLFASYDPSDLTEGFALGPPALPGSFASLAFERATIEVIPEPLLMSLVGLGIAGVTWRRAGGRRR